MKWPFKSKEVDPIILRLAEAINAKNECNLVSPDDSTYYVNELPFYSDFKLYTFVDLSFTPFFQIRLLDNGCQTIVLDGTVIPFIEAATISPLVLTKQVAFEYAKLVLSTLQKDYGHFHLLVSVDDIDFSAEPSPEEYSKLESAIKSPKISKLNGSFRLSASLVYGDSIYDADILVNQNGRVDINQMEKVLENMPIKELMLE